MIFKAEDSDYCIVAAEGGLGQFKAKGHFFTQPKEGLSFNFEGKWRDSPKYGREFYLTKATPVVEKTLEGVKTFLSATVKFVGEYRAQALVDHFGVDLLDVLDNHPERLEELPRSVLTKQAREHLTREWQRQSSYRDAAIFLLGHGIPNSLVERIYNKYLSKTKEVVSANPYVLTTIPRIGFVTADKIALNMGIALDSQVRLREGILYCLQESSREGHLYLTGKQLIQKTLALFAGGNEIQGAGRVFELSEIKDGLRTLKDEERIVIDEQKRIYTSWSHTLEDRSAQLLARIMQAENAFKEDFRLDIEDYIQEYEQQNGIQFSTEQRNGIRALHESKVLLITGLPGTGKTVLTKALVGMFRKAGLTYHLLTPTGISAKRMGDVVGEGAATIHRALGYKGDHWDCGPHNLFPTDAIIVDEISMVDQEVFYRLLSALPDRVILVLVGDAAQLPSVGAGNVLHELQASKSIPHVNLTRIFRQDEASDIVLNAHRINDGEVPTSQKGGDFLFRSMKEPNEIVEKIVEIAVKLYEKEQNFQVLSPKYASPVGVDNLNVRLREALNPPASGKTEIKLGQHDFRTGDRVMVTKNDYTLGVYNGDVGKISEINKRDKEIRVKIFGSPVIYVDFDYAAAMDMLKHAYAMTIHKSQGMEYDYILFPFTYAFYRQLQRNLLYTAVTRAKERVVIYGEERALARAVGNNEVRERNSALAERLISYLAENSSSD